jgi:threonine/homoserine/homoserine lactone efflux protein
VVIGTISAAVAVGPSLTKSAHDLPLLFIGGLIAMIVVVGFGVCASAASAAMRGRLLDAVRRE